MSNQNEKNQEKVLPPPTYEIAMNGSEKPQIEQPGTCPQPIFIVQQIAPHPFHTTCPVCSRSILTRMEFKPDLKTHLLSFLLCTFGLICCLWVPYCVDSCQEGNHYCPYCNAYIGTFSGN